jgi:hypothetical protein
MFRQRILELVTQWAPYAAKLTLPLQNVALSELF